jgi:hypothetical protein
VRTTSMGEGLQSPGLIDGHTPPSRNKAVVDRRRVLIGEPWLIACTLMGLLERIAFPS